MSYLLFALAFYLSEPSAPTPPPAPEPDFECMRECRQANMMRAVGPEVIDQDCRRSCTPP